MRLLFYLKDIAGKDRPSCRDDWSYEKSGGARWQDGQRVRRKTPYVRNRESRSERTTQNKNDLWCQRGKLTRIFLFLFCCCLFVRVCLLFYFLYVRYHFLFNKKKSFIYFILIYIFLSSNVRIGYIFEMFQVL